ncbi:uncharacterized [Tachysurus ichikawai]
MRLSDGVSRGRNSVPNCKRGPSPSGRIQAIHGEFVRPNHNKRKVIDGDRNSDDDDDDDDDGDGGDDGGCSRFVLSRAGERRLHGD